MTEWTDNTGTPVKVTVDETGPISTYTVTLADGSAVGSAEFVDSRGTDNARIFFHTEVTEEFGGRGLAGLLVREALADSIRKSLTVVPVCPLFAGHLTRHGGEFIAEGGVFRRPMPADIALVKRATRSGA